MKNRTRASFVGIVALSALTLTACAAGGDTTTGDGAEEGLVSGLTGEVGAKDFSEQFILAHITSQLLNANGADTTANTSVVGSANVRAALEGDDFLGYWEYTGTSWITYNGNTAPVVGEEAQFEATKKADADNGIAWLDAAPFNNTYAFAILSDKAKKLGVATLSDIAALPVEDQTFCIESEFSTRDDGWPGLKKAYGIEVPDSNVSLLDTGVIYDTTAKGDVCNFGEVFATDGRISALQTLGEIAVAIAGYTTLGAALGSILRAPVVAVAVAIGWLLPIEQILGSVIDGSDRWLPGSLLTTIASGGTATVALGAALVTTATYLAVAMGAAGVLFKRRDVTA